MPLQLNRVTCLRALFTWSTDLMHFNTPLVLVQASSLQLDYRATCTFTWLHFAALHFIIYIPCWEMTRVIDSRYVKRAKVTMKKCATSLTHRCFIIYILLFILGALFLSLNCHHIYIDHPALLHHWLYEWIFYASFAFMQFDAENCSFLHLLIYRCRCRWISLWEKFRFSCYLSLFYSASSSSS